MTAAVAIFDPRMTLARPDLAEQALEGLVHAEAYRAVRPMHCAVPFVALRAEADAASEQIDELIYGEAFDMLDARGELVWGRARRDGVVGWIPASALSTGAPAPTHRIASPSAALPLNALIVERAVGVKEDDLTPVGRFESDPLAVAERLLGVPHSPGARSSVATDGSGLIQQALYACGLPGPRHSDQQAELGVAVERSQALRGDLVVWPAPAGNHAWTGHSAFMLDQGHVLHATGHHGAVVVEAFGEADARYRAGGFSAPVFRRLQA
ncbi:NlpC/P60 family protein [Brevundimonas sp.]|uniref:C40 family peptidase n=1 Tax=Brevundimonas sp. TaxID=1871086 RepID=UPI0035640D01